MKKLLSILAAIGLTATASATVVACSTEGRVKTLEVGKDGIAHVTMKLILKEGTVLHEKDNNYVVENPNFAFIKSDKRVEHDSDFSSFTSYGIVSFTTEKKYIQSKHIVNGALDKDLETVAKVSFKLSPKVKSYSEKIALIATDNNKVDKTIEMFKANVAGTGSEPTLLSASIDGKVITVDTKDIKDVADAKANVKIDTLPEGNSIVSAAVTSNKLTINLANEIEQTYDDQTFTISYEDAANNINKISTKLVVKAEGKPQFSGVSYDGATTVKVNGTNLKNWLTPLASSDVEITDSNNKVNVTSLNIASDTEIDITLSSAIERTFDQQSFTVKIKSEQVGTFTVSPKGKPAFTNASYDATKKQITITGTDFDNFTFDKSKLTVADNTISDASLSGNTITATVATSFKEYKDVKSYAVTYTDTEFSTNSSFKINGSTLEQTASYDGNTTVTVNGTNLGVNADVKSQISGIDNVASAKTDDNKLTITLSKPITKTINDQQFNVTYKLTGDSIAYTASFTVNKDTSLNPTWTKAEVTGSTIKVTGTHLDQITDWSSVEVTGLPSGITKQSATATTETELDITLSGEIKPTDDDQTITVSYKGNDLDLSATATVAKGKPTVSKVSGNSITGTTASTTVTVVGEYLGQVTKSDIKLSGADKTGKLALDDISISDSSISIAVNGASFEANGDYKISLGHGLNDVDLTVKMDEPAPKVNADQTFNLNADGTITVLGNYLDQVQNVSLSPANKITVSVKTAEMTSLVLNVSGLAYENNDTYSITIAGVAVTLTTNAAYPAAQVDAGQKFNLQANGSIVVKGKYMDQLKQSDVSVSPTDKISISSVTPAKDSLTINITGVSFENNGDYTLTIKGVTVKVTVAVVGTNADITMTGVEQDPSDTDSMTAIVSLDKPLQLEVQASDVTAMNGSPAQIETKDIEVTSKVGDSSFKIKFVGNTFGSISKLTIKGFKNSDTPLIDKGTGIYAGTHKDGSVFIKED